MDTKEQINSVNNSSTLGDISILTPSQRREQERLRKEQEEKDAIEEANEEYQNDVIENMSKKVEEAIADIEANGYQANYVKTDAYGNPIMGTETENQRLLRVMKQHKQHLEAAVRLASRNVERQDKLIDEYKATDKLITKLEKAIRKAAMKQY